MFTEIFTVKKIRWVGLRRSTFSWEKTTTLKTTTTKEVFPRQKFWFFFQIRSSFSQRGDLQENVVDCKPGLVQQCSEWNLSFKNWSLGSHFFFVWKGQTRVFANSENSSSCLMCWLSNAQDIGKLELMRAWRKTSGRFFLPSNSFGQVFERADSLNGPLGQIYTAATCERWIGPSREMLGLQELDVSSLNQLVSW